VQATVVDISETFLNARQHRPSSNFSGMEGGMMDSAYVSEFTLFMNRFLEQHPEVVKDQQRRWDFSWHPEIDLVAQQEAEEDRVPDDTNGFNWLAGRRT
jgi:hypothetical protein